jgi:hypothetical protein
MNKSGILNTMPSEKRTILKEGIKRRNEDHNAMKIENAGTTKGMCYYQLFVRVFIQW